ncbi:hypothetical protein JB92DRAFT_1947190 [Gautieria morchelliformis]|nr:hypothetical protein JB92DRAFT_1947190 [Gautieria morchelliformis]
MVENSCITLYDTASRTDNPWNPMSLRSRLALNFTGLPIMSCLAVSELCAPPEQSFVDPLSRPLASYYALRSQLPSAMVENSCITLYDTASRTGNPCNPMSLRARLALNFTGLPFKTVWLEYPNIELTLRGMGAAPTFFDSPSPRKWFYTIPVIVDPGHLTSAGDPTVIPDSWAIAEYLDEIYPNQNILFPPGTKAFQTLFIDHPIKHAIFDILPPHGHLTSFLS